jgi:hypothetical protein
MSLDNALTRVIAWADSEAIPRERWKTPDGYRSTGYAVLDAVYSQQQNYERIIRPLMHRFSDRFGADNALLDVNWLQGTLASAGGILAGAARGIQLGSFVGNNSRTGYGKLLYKGIVVENLCSTLLAYRSPAVVTPLNSIDDFSQIFSLSHPAFDREVMSFRRRIEGATGGVRGIGVATSRYLLILLGQNKVKPDIHINWWFRTHLGAAARFTDEEIAVEVEECVVRLQAAEVTRKSVRDVDHLLWNMKSKCVICLDGLPC